MEGYCSVVKNPPAIQVGSILGSGRSPGEGHGNPLQYSCLRYPMDRGTWQAIVLGGCRVRHDLATEHVLLQKMFEMMVDRPRVDTDKVMRSNWIRVAISLQNGIA